MIHLIILHTNDLHGRVSQLCRIATLIRKIRDEADQNGCYCLYLDAGDSEDTTLLESALTRGSSMNVFLRSAGCDEVALGNAIPIRYGPQALENISMHFGKPILCANLLEVSGANVPGLAPYVIKDLDGFKIAVVGLTAPMDIYAEVFHYQVNEPRDVLPGLLHSLREKGVRFVIALTHVGSNQDISLAKQIPGIDVILGGHDHKQITPSPDANGTLIAHAGELGQFLGRLDLVIDPETGKVTEQKAQLIPVTEDIPEDALVLQAVKEEKEKVLLMMRDIIGATQVPIPSYGDRESPAGNLLADAILERIPGAQLSLIVNGHWGHGLKAGTISIGELNSALRSTGNPARVELTGSQIRQFLVNALLKENITRSLKAFRGTTVGLPHVAGIRVIVDQSAPENLEIFINDRRMDETATYIVATSDMEISDILNYLYIPDEQVEYEIPTILPDVMEDYIRRHTPIIDVPGNRIVWKSFIK